MSYKIARAINTRSNNWELVKTPRYMNLGYDALEQKGKSVSNCLRCFEPNDDILKSSRNNTNINKTSQSNIPFLPISAKIPRQKTATKLVRGPPFHELRYLLPQAIHELSGHFGKNCCAIMAIIILVLLAVLPSI